MVKGNPTPRKKAKPAPQLNSSQMAEIVDQATSQATSQVLAKFSAPTPQDLLKPFECALAGLYKTNTQWLRETFQPVQEQLFQVTTEAAQARNERNTAKAELAATRQDLEKIKSDSGERARSFKQRKRKLLNQLRHVTVFCERDCAEKDGQIAELRHLLEAANASFATANEQLARAREEIAAKDQLLADITAERDTERQERERAEEGRNQALEQVETLNQEVGAANDLCEELLQRLKGREPVLA